MKSLVCLIAVAVAVGAQDLTNGQSGKLNQIHKECKNQTGVPQDRIDKIRVGIFMDEPRVKSQVLCVLKKNGLMTDSGDFVVGTFKSKLRKVTDADEEVDRIFKKCVVKKGTPDQTAFDAYKCVHGNKPTFSPVL